jgi:hypothetical protein
MRPIVVVAALLLAVGLLGIIALASKSLRSRPAGGPPAELVAGHPSPPAAANTSAEPATAAATAIPPIAVAPDPNSAAGKLAAAAHAEAVRKRIGELDALAMKHDPASRDVILAELQNPDKAIRQGALEAAIQLGDRSVVPRLQEIAAQTEDPDEKAALLAAVDYINLPSLTEYLNEQKAQRAARGITNGPELSTNALRRPHHSRQQPPPGPAGAN